MNEGEADPEEEEVGEEGHDRNNMVPRGREQQTAAAASTIPGLVVEVEAEVAVEVAEVVVEGGPETRQREWKDPLQTISHVMTLRSYLELTIRQLLGELLRMRMGL